MDSQRRLAAFTWLAAIPFLSAAGDDEWKRGSELQKALDAPVAIRGGEQPLGVFLTQLAGSQRIACFLDRRIDPSSPRSFGEQKRSLRSVFFLTADVAQAGSCVFGDVLYVGPGPVAAALPELLSELRAEVRKLSPDARKKWQRSQALQIPRLARPGEILRQLAEENGLLVSGLESIPHDLWPAVDLPPLPLAERFAYLLVGFDKWPEIGADGSSVSIVDVKLPQLFSRIYSPEDRSAFVAWLRQSMPEVRFEARSSSITVDASPIQHHGIALWIADHEKVKQSIPAGATKVVSLHATASAGNIARQVADQLGVEFRVDDGLQERLEKRVEIHLDQVSYHELLTAVFADTGLSFELDDRQLRVFAQ